MAIRYLKLLYCLLGACPLLAHTVTLRRQVTGAVRPAARITVTGPSGLSKTATAAIDGRYSFAGFTPGNYTDQVFAPDLARPQPAKISLTTSVETLNLGLRVVSTTQRVAVRDNAGPALTADATSNASALVLRGADLEALADNPDDLHADPMALAGPSAGPGCGAIYIYEFSGGQLPAKESIREIRINQNPFSPEFDKLGYRRIEIFTKPGTDKFHGAGFYNFGNSFWNTRNPCAQQKTPFLLKRIRGRRLNGGKSPLQPEHFDVDSQSAQPYQSRADHRQHHVAAVRPSPTSRAVNLGGTSFRKRPITAGWNCKHA